MAVNDTHFNNSAHIQKHTYERPCADKLLPSVFRCTTTMTPMHTYGGFLLSIFRQTIEVIKTQILLNFGIN